MGLGKVQERQIFREKSYYLWLANENFISVIILKNLKQICQRVKTRIFYTLA